MKPLYLIDSSIYIFRAYYSISQSFVDPEGRDVNAVYGYSLFLLDLLSKVKPEYITAAFDESLFTGFRHKLYPEYKANRELPDAALEYQLAACREITELLGVASFSSTTYEADDIIGTLANRLADPQRLTCIITKDKDLGQLLYSERHCLWDYAGAVVSYSKDVKKKLGVEALQIADFIGLAGDASDNIPGVPGIGVKTASALLEEFASLEQLYTSLDEVQKLAIRGAKKLKGLLLEHTAQAFMCKKLATIAVDVHDHREAFSLILLEDVRWQKPVAEEVVDFFSRMGFGSAIVHKLNKCLASKP